MLLATREAPPLERIGYAYIIPFASSNLFAMTWDHVERRLVSIGGRRDPQETLEECLARRAYQAAGVVLAPEVRVVASQEQEGRGEVSVFVVGRILGIDKVPTGPDASGPVLLDRNTADALVRALAVEPTQTLELLRLATGVMASPVPRSSTLTFLRGNDLDPLHGPRVTG